MNVPRIVRMRHHHAIVLLVAAIVTFPCCTGGNSLTGDRSPSLVCDASNGSLVLPEGFCALVVADKVGAARHLAVTPAGHEVYVRLSTARADRPGGIVVLRDTSGDGRADVVRAFSETVGTGIAIENGYLYASSVSTIVRYPLTSGDEVAVRTPEVVVADLPRARFSEHLARPFAFDGAGSMYVHIPAPSDSCGVRGSSHSPDPCSELKDGAGVWRFRAQELNQSYDRDRVQVASGIRSSVGMQWSRKDNLLYLVNHGRSDLNHRAFPSTYPKGLFPELPADELLAVSPEGGTFGWPYCYPDASRARLVLAPDYGGDGAASGRCRQFKEPLVMLPAHAAPNDLLLYAGTQFPPRYREGMFIALHGGWNDAGVPPTGYRVVFQPMADRRPTGPLEDFATGFVDFQTIQSPEDALYRPVGLAEGPDGSLFIADSKQGRIWRVVYQGHQRERTSP